MSIYLTFPLDQFESYCRKMSSAAMICTSNMFWSKSPNFYNDTRQLDARCLLVTYYTLWGIKREALEKSLLFAQESNNVNDIWGI